MNKEVTIDYTNWRGERGMRNIRPMSFLFGSNKWHQTPQWLVQAIDLDEGIIKTFALANIHSWSERK